MTTDAWIASVPPGLFLILAGIALLGLRGQVRKAVVVAAPALLLVWMWVLPEGIGRSFEWFGLELAPVRIDELGRLFGTVFAIAGVGGGLFAVKQERTAELASALIYAGAAIGVVFAGDLITVFVFWEVMAVASTLVVLAGGRGARKAAQRYIVIHLFGGVLLMAGIAGHIGTTGSTAFTLIEGDSPARWLILAGFLLNAAAWPISSWLPDAYPRASWSGMVFLSAFTTKTAVYVLIRSFAGEDILIWLGLIMVFYGIIYAILANDMRRMLAYSIVNQIGYMLVGVGIGTEIALNGAATHAFAHIIYKALLLMSAGAVLYQTGRSKFSELGGLARTMPITAMAAIVGALSITAFPFTSGFIGKSLIAEGASSENLEAVWFLITAASAGAVLYAAKFLWFVFFRRGDAVHAADPPAPMLVAMVAFAAGCLILGVFPQMLDGTLPFAVSYDPYTTPKIVFQFQLLLFAVLAFFILLRWIRPNETVTLDTDWLWRRAIPRLRAWIESDARRRFWRGVERGVERFRIGLVSLTGPGAVLARSLPTGAMAFWATILLAAYLIFYYL